MRWVFLSLVCLNLLVMVWFWRDQAGVVDVRNNNAQTSASGQSLILLSELERSELDYKTKQSDDSDSREQRCYSVGPFKDENDAKFL